VTPTLQENTLLYRKGNENHELRKGFFVHKGNILPLRTVEFVSDKM
jgi:hypothetical protein